MQGFRVGGRTAGFASIQSLLSVVFVGHAIIAARSPRERVRIAGEFALETATGALLVRLFGGPVVLGLSMMDVQTDSPTPRYTAEAVRRLRFQQLWREHVDAVVALLAIHVQAYECVLDDLETLVEEVRRLGATISRDYALGRLAVLGDELAEQTDMIAAALQQISQADVHGVRQALVQQGLPMELVADLMGH